MGFEPSRMLETGHVDDAALCLEIERFKAQGPTAAELGSVHDALKRDLGMGLHEPLAEADSGVRVLPLPLFPTVVEQPAVERAPEPKAEPEFRFWTNATVSRTIAAFAVAAALALLWSRLDRPESGAITAEQRNQAQPPAPIPSEDAAPASAFVRRSVPPGQDSSAQAAPAEASHKPVARARATGASSRRARVSAPVQDGKLNINSIPYSRVVLDGRPLGATPRVEVAVSPGAHTVVFVHPEHGRILKEVYVDAGRTVLAAVRFE